MKAIVFEKTGDASVTHLADVPVPELRPGLALMRVRAAGINFADTFFIRGEYLIKPSLPEIPGLEAAGVIEAVAPDVKNLKPRYWCCAAAADTPNPADEASGGVASLVCGGFGRPLRGDLVRHIAVDFGQRFILLRDIQILTAFFVAIGTELRCSQLDTRGNVSFFLLYVAFVLSFVVLSLFAPFSACPS